MFVLLCIVSAFVFLLIYEFWYKKLKDETRTFINLIFVIGIILIGVIAVNTKPDSSSYAPTFADSFARVDNTYEQVPTTTTLTTVPEASEVNETVDTFSPAVESTEIDTDPVLADYLRQRTEITDLFIQAVNENYSQNTIVSLQNDMNRINDQINTYINRKNDVSLETTRRDLQAEVDAKMREIDLSQSSLNMNLYDQAPINTTTYTPPNALYNSASTNLPTSNHTYPSTYVNPNANTRTEQVSGYMRQNGTYVQPYTRTIRNNTKTDNFSYRP
jgi:hypothetical protein